jgi:hypothetical protein
MHTEFLNTQQFSMRKNAYVDLNFNWKLLK